MPSTGEGGGSGSSTPGRRWRRRERRRKGSASSWPRREALSYGYRIQQYFPYLEERGYEVSHLTTRTGIITCPCQGAPCRRSRLCPEAPPEPPEAAAPEAGGAEERYALQVRGLPVAAMGDAL